MVCLISRKRTQVMVVGILRALHLLSLAWYLHCMPPIDDVVMDTVYSHSKWTSDSDVCDITEAQWQLISWYFQRVPYVEISEITDSHRGQSHFGNRVSKEWSKRYNKTVFTQSVDYGMRENLTSTQKYGWRGTRFDQQSNASNDIRWSVVQARDTAASVQQRAKQYNGTRDDSPSHGSLVLVEYSKLIDGYLVGYPRRPFRQPRANFIIVVYKLEVTTSWETTASRVLSRLWQTYGVLNALIMSTCHPSDVNHTQNGQLYFILYINIYIHQSEQLYKLEIVSYICFSFLRVVCLFVCYVCVCVQVGYFDPFKRVFGRNVSTELDGWGIFKWIPIRLLNFDDDWLLRKENALNGFPVTVTMFMRYPTAVPHDRMPLTFMTNYFNRNINNSRGTSGFDGLVLANMAEVLDFNAEIRTPVAGSYGSLQKNQTYSGECLS